MKRILCFLACLSLILAGCGKKTAIEETNIATNPVETTVPVAVDTPDIIPEQVAMYAVDVPTDTQVTRAEDDTVIFSCTNQTIHMTIPEPEVAEKIASDFESRIESGKPTADSILAAAQANYDSSPNWTPYLYDLTYSPMRMDQGILSLYGNCVTFSGSAHPERIGVSASYDLLTGDVLTLASIMTPEAVTDDFCKLVINKLTALKNELNLYEGFEQTVEYYFSQDESLNEDWYFSTTGLCFYFAPYEVAPYSSGVIIAEIPYSELVGLLYDGYFPAERETASGALLVTDLNNTDISQFSQIAELIRNPDGQIVFLHTKGLVWNFKIECGVWHSNNTAFTPVYTALFSAALSPGDAVMLQSNDLTDLRISYICGDETIIAHLVQTEQGIEFVF